MKCLYSSGRSNATWSLTITPLSRTHHFQEREAFPTSRLLVGDSIVHARPYGVFCDLVKRYHVASGISSLSLVWFDEAIFDAVISRGSQCVSEQRNKLRFVPLTRTMPRRELTLAKLLGSQWANPCMTVATGD